MNSTNFFLDLFDFNNNSFLNSFSIFSSAEVFTVLFLFNFIQLLVVTTISELVWPTQIFNKIHNINYNTYRLRTYTETIEKLGKFTKFYKIFNKIVLKLK